MFTRATLAAGLEAIAAVMEKNRQYLIELDQRNGDGDLGISMAEGYAAASRFAAQSSEDDLGKLLSGVSRVFNEAAPSSLGTITSLWLMGMARALKGATQAGLPQAAAAMREGINKIMEKAGSKPGEKTILDALDPAVRALENAPANDIGAALKQAAQAARQGSQSTANMPAVHGRAAYYGEKAIGLIDGGSVVGQLIFEALAEAFA